MTAKIRKTVSTRRKMVAPSTNGEVVIPIMDGYQKRRIFVKNFAELLEDDLDIQIICEDLSKNLRKILDDNGNLKNLHVEVSVFREEKQ